MCDRANEVIIIGNYDFGSCDFVVVVLYFSISRERVIAIISVVVSIVVRGDDVAQRHAFTRLRQRKHTQKITSPETFFFIFGIFPLMQKISTLFHNTTVQFCLN